MIRYGDKVRIREGFYKNVFGIAIDCHNEFLDLMTGETGDLIYTIEISHIDKNNCWRKKEIKIKENKIEKSKED